MPFFSVSNSLATFQYFVNDIFRDILDQSDVIYLDDIFIFSENPTLHHHHIQQLLERL